MAGQGESSEVTRARRRHAAWWVSVCVSLSACGDEGGGGASATDATGASTGASVDDGGDDAMPDDDDDGPGSGDDAPDPDDTGNGSEDTGPPVDDGPSLALWNVVRGETEAASSPLPDVVYRVEIAPRVTLQAIVPAGTASATIVVDGTSVADASAPFLFDEDAEGNAAPWALGFGAHDWEVAALDANGDELGHAAGTFELSDVGMDPAYVPLDAAGHDAWVASELDGVMEVRITSAPSGGFTVIARSRESRAGTRMPRLGRYSRRSSRTRTSCSRSTLGTSSVWRRRADLASSHRPILRVFRERSGRSGVWGTRSPPF